MIKRKLSHNENGISTLNAVILLVVIGLLVWQFVIPFLGYPSITDLYSEYQEQKAENLNYNFDLVDTITGERIVPTSTKNFNTDDPTDYSGAVLYYVLDKTDAHSIKLITNIPYSLTNPYYVRFITTEIKQFESTNPSNSWGMEFLSDSNIIYESTGKLTTDEYKYNMGSEIRLNDGILYIYGNLYEIIVLSPNNQILYKLDFVIRMDD